MPVARWLASNLERGTLASSTTARALGNAWATLARRTLDRPLSLPQRTDVVGIGSAVLGGAGKTPVAVEYARRLAAQGCHVAFVGHAFRAAARSPRIVRGHEAVDRVGDDALVAARALEGTGVEVWVGQDRGATLMAAARSAQVLVVDGLLQTRPQRLTRSVLVLDAEHQFGTGRCPPAGDLRGPADEVLALCDEVVIVSDALEEAAPGRADRGLTLPRHLSLRSAFVDISGARGCNRRFSLEDLRSRRVGLLTLVAHPERVESSIRRRGIRPLCVWHGADHGPLGFVAQRWLRSSALRIKLDAWLVTPKCVTHLRDRDLGCEVLVTDVSTRLDPDPRPVLDSRPCVPRES